MRIWIDTSIKTLIHMNDCSAPRQFVPSVFPLTAEKIQVVRNRVLRHAPALYIQACLDERWFVCNPVGAGQLIVMDAHALLVLERFRHGHTPAEVADATVEGSLTTIENFAAILYSLGLLQDVHAVSARASQDQEETLTAWMHVTNACNLRCSYCYITKTNEVMADETAKRSVDAVMRSALKHHFRRVMLKYAGGEASLRADNLLAMHDYAVEQAQRSGLELGAQVLSNGVFLSQRTIEQLVQRRIALSISLDGIGASHDSQRSFINGRGSFKYVERTMTRLLANGVVPHILITVSQNNLAGMPDLMNYILERELPFSISYYRDTECSTSRQELRFSNAQMIATMRDVFALIERKLPRQSLMNALIDKADLSSTHSRTCGVGHNYLVIDQRGGVAKCQADIKHTVSTIDAADPLQAVQEDLVGIQNLPVAEKQGCQQCSWRSWCAGGCPLLTYKITGRYDIKSPNCDIYQALIPDALRLEALRLLTYETPLLISSDTHNLCSLVV